MAASIVTMQSVRVVKSASCGRKLVATSRFPPGKCILEELEPYGYTLLNDKRGFYCDLCLKQCQVKSPVKTCPICRLYVRYCSTSCQEDDWKRCHEQDCKALMSNGPEQNQDIPQLLSQMIRKQSVPSPHGDDCFPTGVYQLKSHDKLGSHLPKEQFELLLKQFIEEGVLTDIELSSLSKVYGATLCNLFTIRDNDLKGIAVAIYLRAAMANHSCDANCALVYDGIKLQLRTVKDVKEGEELTISYLIDHFNYPTEERRALLKCFTCKCGKCMEKRNALTPNEVAEVERLKESKEGIDVQIMDASKSQDWTKVLQKLEPYLKSTASSCLPADHHLLVEVREIAFEIYMKMKSWDKAAQMGQLIIQPYRDYYGPYHPNLGVHLLKMGQVQHQLRKLQEARQYLTEAESVLEVTHGPQHSLMASVKKLLFKCR